MNAERMAEEIERYLTSHAPLVGPGPPPSEPMGKKAKGSSRPPVGSKAFAFWEANRIAADFIEWRVGDITKHNNAYNGIQFSELVTELYRNPAISQTWKAAEDDSANVAAMRRSIDIHEGRISKIRRAFTGVHGKRRRHANGLISRLEARVEPIKARIRENPWLNKIALEKMCRLIAQDILAINPGASFFVHVNPKPLKDLDEEDDATPLLKPGAKHHRNRRYTYEHTARKRYERVQELEKCHGCTRTAAVAMLSEELDVGVATIWRAVCFCEEKAS